ncbi:MAG TPA: AIPR family protein [Solirubrobacterales bacterium]
MSKPRDQELKQLRSELGIFRDEFPRLSDDDLFVVWFLFAFVTGDKAAAVSALTGPSREKSIDALHIDHTACLVTLVQGKYRQKLMGSGESRADVLEFASLAQRLAGDDESFGYFLEGLEGGAAHLAKQARDVVVGRNYRLNLHFATLGRCSSSLQDEARRQVRKVDIPASQRPRLTVLTGDRVMAVFRDYLDGVAPPVASIELPVEGKPQERVDEASMVSSSTFSINGWEIGQLVHDYGVKLFARNIRGYLGETGINHEIRRTLRKDPVSFWYLNNGITIVCDDAILECSSGHERIVISNPQIINGQQTSYALSAEPRGAARAHVSVRLINVAREGKADDFAAYDAMVAKIVEATNSQNKIKASDLRANDRLQVGLERSLRRLGYFYQRKRAAPAEVARLAGQHEWKVTKEAVAKAVVGCENAFLVRRGTDQLFEEPLYRRIFSRAPRQLLCCWWLSKAVDWAARGTNEQPAKYVVLQFLWADLGPIIRANQRPFIDMFEGVRQDTRYPHLDRAIARAFKGAMAYYRSERGTGADAIDPLSFFKRQEAYDGFAKFREHSELGHFRQYERSAEKLSAALVTH